MFKRLFGSVGSEAILKDLLEAILDIKIESVELDLDKEIMPENLNGKRNVLDVRTNLADGTQVNVEMQMTVPEYLEKRNLDYWANLYIAQLKKGGGYDSLKKTIAIWILDENFFKDLPEYHTKWIIKESKSNVDKYFEDFEVHFLELQKLREGAILKPKKLDFWMWFIDYTNEEMVKMAYENEEQVREALEKLKELSSDSALVDLLFRQRMYEMDQEIMQRTMKERAEKEGREAGMKEGMKEGMKAGLEKGKKAGLKAGLEKGKKAGIEEGKRAGLEKEKMETAKRMLKANIQIELIMQATELTKEEILKIKEEL